MYPERGWMFKMWAPHGLWEQPTQLWDYSAHKLQRDHITSPKSKKKKAVAICQRACHESKQNKPSDTLLSVQLEQWSGMNIICKASF